MNREWVNKKIEEEKKRRKNILDSIVNEVEKYDLPEKEEILQSIEKKEYGTANFLVRYAIHDYLFKHEIKSKEIYDKFNKLGLKELSGWYSFESVESIYERYLDSEPKHFSGTIIITDPCYIIKDGTDDWSRCYYGDDLEELGLETFLVTDTLYGDWSCTTFDEDTKKPIGEFCADAGLVGVFLLDEVLEYNPKFDYHINKKWATTTIEDFDGMAQVVVKEKDNDYSVHIVGHGRNKRTGEPINFITKQTGF